MTHIESVDQGDVDEAQGNLSFIFDHVSVERFLSVLDPGGKFTFQTFDDNVRRRKERAKTKKPDPFARKLHGSIQQCGGELCWLNTQGAGIFVCINETDGKGREIENVVRVRALFVDLDDTPLPEAFHIPPHIIVESSPGKHQAQWLVKDCPLDPAKFEELQKRLAAFYGGDKSVHDLPRVMRIPGFYHQKEAPFRSLLLETSDHEAFTVDEIMAGIPELAEEEQPKTNGQAGPIDLNALTPLQRLNSLALANLDKWVPELFPQATKRLEDKGWRVTSTSLDRDLEEDISIHPTGIKDFGVHDQGDSHKGKRTAIELIAEWKTNGNKTAAIRWLCDTLEIPVEDRPSTAIALTDFRSYMPGHNYIYLPTREPWPASSVNARIPPVPVTNFKGEPVLGEDGKPKTVKANLWLDQNRPVEQMVWCPGQPMLIADHVVDQGGWIEQLGTTILNLYRPPTIPHGDPMEAGPWIEHVRRIYPDEADHIIKYLAQRVQQPAEKINHGLVLGGPPGVGKDTILEPVKHAVGPWNMREVSPQQVQGRFNPFIKSIILRISEARDLGEMNRFAFYEHLKQYEAAPPDTLTCDEKNLREHSVFNVMGVIITSNRQDSFYLPEDDRRHFVAWTDLTKEDFTKAYWDELWGWYYAGGFEHVAAYLATLDLSGFDPKAPPPKTEAFWEIVGLNRSPEDAEFADALDVLGNPDAVTIDMIKSKADHEFFDWLQNRGNIRRIPHRMKACSYTAVDCKDRKDGYWKIGGKRQAIYAKVELAERDRLAAAEALVRNPPGRT
jgi:hypothetical protein